MERFKIRKMTEGDVYVTVWQVSGDVKPQDINEAVYAAMCEAGQDVLSQSGCRLSGEHTAAELAGRSASGIPVVEVPETMAKEVRINVGMISVGYKQQAPMFTCGFATDTVFEQVAEWEGVMGMPSKKYHRFVCVSEDGVRDEVQKPYVRHHGYRPTTVSVAATNDRLAGNFDVLGHLYEALSAEGIRRAMSVLAAARKFENKGYEVQAMVKRAMCWKRWRDYGNCERLCRREDWLKGEMSEMRRHDQYGSRYKDMEKELQLIRWKYTALSRPIPFSEQDFKGAPECYLQVDDAYVRELVAHWNRMVADSPMPEWPKNGDVVMFCNREKMQKKYQGKFLCEGMTASLSTYGDRIEWRASVRVKKFTNEYFLPEQLEPAPDDKKKAKVKTTTKTTKTTGKAKAKASAEPKTEPKAETLSLAERLGQALLARLAA